MNRDTLRSACLLFSDELVDGIVTPADLDRPEIVEAVIDRQVPSGLSRRFQARAIRRGDLSYDRDVVPAMVAARTAVLGAERAAGPPRVLLRVDGFPHHEAADDPQRRGSEAFARLHATLRDAGVPYLVSVLPWVPHAPRDPQRSDWRPHDEDERALLHQLRRDGVAFAVHGLDHRARKDDDRPSELLGLKRKELTDRLDTAVEVLRDDALHADVFVAPWDRFDVEQYGELSARWDVVCGGPATVAHLGFHATPVWRGDAVYLPSHPPLTGPAAAIAAAVEDLATRRTALWTPVTVDWAAEADAGWEGLQELAAVLAGLARPWDEFLAAIAFSRRVAASTTEPA